MWHCYFTAEVDVFCLTGVAFPGKEKFSDELIKGKWSGVEVGGYGKAKEAV